MKVVLFCGGMGMRIRDYSENVPKPLVPIGPRPILMHLMSYYAYFGYKDFVLCLGYRGEAIKEFFLNYNEAMSNDFVLGDGEVKLLARDIDDWRITFVDTGLQASVGERLMAVKHHLEGEEMFLANYADGLSDVDMRRMVADFTSSNAVASFLSVNAPHTFHIVSTGPDQIVEKIEHVANSHVRVNGGFFVLRREIFEYMKPGEDLVVEPFQRLIRDRLLRAYSHEGFWAAMDTFKDKQTFEDMVSRGCTPWEIWKS